jgi:hypothetical protein
MYSYTNQSLFIFTELKYRCYYIIYSLFMLMIYLSYYFNIFLVIFLKPIEYLNLDTNLSFFISFLMNLFTLDVYDLEICEEQKIISTNDLVSHYDFYPTFEISMKNNFNIYFYILLYFILLLATPILIYQIYIFFLPALYKYEKNFFFFFLFFFLTFTYLFIEYVNNFFCFIYLLFT